jgi:hypothetical protein
MGLAPERFCVPKQTIQKSVVALVKQIEQQPPLKYRSFKTILPCSHAGGGVMPISAKTGNRFCTSHFSRKFCAQLGLMSLFQACRIT